MSPSLLAVSDLHVSHSGNKAVVQRIQPADPGDWLIVAGDVADTVADVEWTLSLLRERFARVIWTPGNHELWTPPHETEPFRGEERYRRLVEVARSLDVLTPEDEFPVWTAPDGEELVVAPLFVLYDYSWRPEGMTIPEALAHGRKTRVFATDEFFLHPDPYPSRQAWAEHRLVITRARLDALPASRRTVLINHWPLHRAPTRILRYPHFAMWCGTDATGDWHQRYRAAVSVYGHLHIPLTLSIDGVRFEEVSLGYPREWRARSSELPQPVRSIIPADPARRPLDHRLLKVYARARRAAAVAAPKAEGAAAALRRGREKLYKMNG